MNISALLKKLEIQIGQLAQFMKASSSKSFPSDTMKNMKDCMVITLWSGIEVEDGRRLGNSKNVVNKKATKENIGK